MKLSYLEDVYKEWRDILVIGKTIERDNRKYHIVGMTLDEEAQLYIIEPYSEPERFRWKTKGVRNQRQIQKEHRENETMQDSYLHCNAFYLGDQRLQVQEGSGGPLIHSMENYEHIKLFFDMLRAGWTAPEWLKDEEWDNLQMVTLTIADMTELPEYSSEMPVIIKHHPQPVQHLLEKTVTLNVGKSRSFSFIDNYGDKVMCYINNVALIDVWKDAEEQFNDPRYAERFSEEQMQEIRERRYEALRQSCPKGMCYIGIEYECSKDLSLQFYSKEYLKSVPETHGGSAVFLLMHFKPDKKTGIHGLPLKGSVIQTPVSPDTSKVPAELFYYMEIMKEWEERV